MIWIILLLLPLSIGVARFNQRLKDRRAVLLAYQQEIDLVKKKFYAAVKMRFLRTPIIVQTEKQLAYYNKMKIYYKNSTRKVELIPYLVGEDKPSYVHRVSNFIDQWCSCRLEEINHGKRAYEIYFEEVRANNLLAYFKSPFDTEESKEFIYQTIQFLLENPKPEHGSYKKELVLNFEQMS